MVNIRSKRSKCTNPFLLNRTNQSLNYALSVLKASVIAPFISHVYLYGSCARQMQRYESDVDILVEFSESIDQDKYHEDVIHLRAAASPVDIDLPVVDIHFVVGNNWRNSNLLYYRNVKRDGIDVWSNDIPAESEDKRL